MTHNEPLNGKTSDKTHRSLISRTENLINYLKCSLAEALGVLPECLSVQKDHFEVNEFIRV
jgi:hypothetical protein